MASSLFPPRRERPRGIDVLQQVEAPRSDRDSDQDQKRHPGDDGVAPDQIGSQTQKEQQPQDKNNGRFA